MAGELSQKETETFYDISADFAEFDPGLEAFDNQLKLRTRDLNSMGGQESMSYHGLIAQLNDEWEHLGHIAKLTGRVYIIEEGIIELAPDSWDGPHTDKRGIYFVVDGAELASLGVIDGNAGNPPVQEKDGSLTYPVQLGYGFNSDDMESDVPMFFASPDDILKADYDEPTYDAIVSRLHHDWPKHMRFIDKHLDSAAGDPMKQMTALQKISRRVDADVIASEELNGWILRYLQNNVELDRYNPYLVTLKGMLVLIDNEQQGVTYLSIEDAVTRSLGFNSIGSRQIPDEYGAMHIDYSLLFDEPTSQFHEEGVAGGILVGPSSVLNIQSSRPVSSLRDMADDALRDEPVLRYDETEPGVTVAAPETETIHRRIYEERRLEAYEKLLADMQKKVIRERRVLYRDRADAIEESARICRGFADDIAALNLQVTDVLSVSGGVYKGIADLTTKTGKFHLDVNEESPIGSPTIDSEVIGYFESIFAAVDRQEDETGPFWMVAPRVKMVVNDIAVPVLISDDFEFLRASVKSSVAVNLDGTAGFELPHLEMIRLRRESLARAAMVERGAGGKVRRALNAISGGLMHESPTEPVVAQAPLLKSIHIAAREITIGGEHREAVDALSQLLSKRLVGVTGEIFSGGKPLGSATLNGALEGVVVMPGNPARVMANIDVISTDLEGPLESPVMVALDSITRLVF
jgi:hypothetical protein